jgi:hypothetical protein
MQYSLLGTELSQFENQPGAPYPPYMYSSRVSLDGAWKPHMLQYRKLLYTCSAMHWYKIPMFPCILLVVNIQKLRLLFHSVSTDRASKKDFPDNSETVDQFF